MTMTSEITVLYRHTDFWVVIKPAGLNFHSEQEAGLVALLQQQYPEHSFYPVHRLDKMTSGLVIMALNLAAAQRFQELFKNRQIEKLYLALSEGKPKKKQGWIKGDMQPARRGSWKLCQTQNNPAITQFRSYLLQPGSRAYLLKPLSGKTHQLRVAMKSLSVPILGDLRYQSVEQAKQHERGYLHAFALRFVWQQQSFCFINFAQQGELFLKADFKRWQQALTKHLMTLSNDCQGAVLNASGVKKIQNEKKSESMEKAGNWQAVLQWPG